MNHKTDKLFSGPVVMLLAVLLASEGSAYAYIDPGTGSYVTQVLVAAIVSVGFVVRAYWSRLTDACRRLFSSRRDKR